MDLSILVCTYNRSESLRRTLESFTRLEVGPGLRWQVVVVDNASTDYTQRTLASFRERLPLVEGREEKQGKSHALNSGLDLCEGRIVFLTDDDVVVDPSWLKATLKAFEAQPVDAVFGRILPRWPGGVPSWYSPRLDPALALLDLGPEPFDLRIGDDSFFGANAAILKDTVEELGRWSVALNRAGSGLLMGEDTEMCERILRAGRRVYYQPESVVLHCFDSRRTHLNYFRRWFYAHGRSSVLRGTQFPAEGPSFLGIPRYLYRQALEYALASAWRWVFRSRAVALAKETKLWSILGAMAQHRKNRKHLEAATPHRG
jgi:glycosyltransferase involved in cell wall biosynthesis